MPIKDKRIPQARESDMRRPNSASTVPWSLILPEGHTVEDTLRPAYWSSIARFFDGKFHNFIDVLNDEHSLYARLYVRAVQENQMIVTQIGETQIFGPVAVEIDSALEPRWNVGKRGYDIVRKADGMVIQDGSKFGVKEQALAWIADHVKKLAA